MSRSHDFDVLFIGGGQAAVPLAPKLCRAGMRVAVVEREHMGGSCVNFGCLPSKAVHASARLAHLARRGADWGIEIGDVRPVLRDVIARAQALVERAETYITKDYERGGVELICAHARLAGRSEEGEGFVVTLDDAGMISSVTARRVVLNTGARTKMPPIDGLSEVDPITAENWIERETLPDRLVVLGGGYIGVEMGQFYGRMGSEVTLVETGGQLLSREDPDVVGCLQACLEAEGLAIRCGTKVTAIERSDSGLLLRVEGGDPMEADAILVATGRRPNTDDLGLETVDIAPDEKGQIDTDPYGETACPGLFAVGDIRPGPPFTNTSHDDHHILRGRLLGERDPGGSPDRRERIVPYAVYSDPEVGRVGTTEVQAKKAGRAFDVVKVDMAGNDRARAIGEPNGMVKLLIERKTAHLLGAAVVAPAGAELVQPLSLLMHLHQPVTAILDALFIHPTLSESLHSAIDQWHKKSAGG